MATVVVEIATPLGNHQEYLSAKEPTCLFFAVQNLHLTSIDNSQPDTLLIPKMKLELLVLWLHTEGTTSYAVGSLGVVNNFELAIFLACC